MENPQEVKTVPQMGYYHSHKAAPDGCVWIPDQKVYRGPYPLRVTCSQYPNQVCMFEEVELKSKYLEIQTIPATPKPYDIYRYAWSPLTEAEIANEVEEEEVEETSSTITPSKINYSFVVEEQIIQIKKSAVPVTLIQYMGYSIKKARESKGIEVTELARQLDHRPSAATIRKVELGEGNTGIIYYERICEALEIHVSDIFPPKTSITHGKEI